LVHPIERLRYVARATGADPALLAQETAAALAALASDPSGLGLVPSCRRLVDRHPTNGPLWSLVARVLTAPEPTSEARRVVAELDADPTAGILAAELPQDATIVLVGWPDVAAAAVRRRGDVEALIIDSGGDGGQLAHRLAAGDNAAVAVPDAGMAAATVVADLVLLEVLAGGPSGVLAAAGSHACAAVARHRGIPVWAVSGSGRVLPGPLWDAMLARLDDRGDEPWERPAELVPATLLDAVVSPDGLDAGLVALDRPSCPVAPELLRRAG
jgi:hypothetical protein